MKTFQFHYFGCWPTFSSVPVRNGLNVALRHLSRLKLGPSGAPETRFRRNFWEFHGAAMEHTNQSANSSPKAREGRVGLHLSGIRNGPLWLPKHTSFIPSWHLRTWCSQSQEHSSVFSPTASSSSFFRLSPKCQPLREASPDHLSKGGPFCFSLPKQPVKH